MEKIIQPISREDLLKELTPDRFIRKTNYGNNEVYIFNHHNSPNLMLEIGRLREVTFRYAGGGTGKETDIDEFDTRKNPYEQLIVWDPDANEILGGYRFYICGKGKVEDDLPLATNELFNFSELFLKKYLPHTIELGRSFVQPDYQSTSKHRKALFALDNLWDGLGAMIVDYPDKKYFFGKVTMYQSYKTKAREMIHFFMDKYFPDKENLLETVDAIPNTMELAELESIFTGTNYDEDYKILSKQVRGLGEMIPPLINAYMNLSPSMKTFGTGINHHFGNVIETGIMVTIPDIFPEKTERHVKTYITDKERIVKY